MATRDRRLLWATWLAVVATAVAAWALGAFTVADQAADDARFAVRGTQAPNPDVVLVLIDERTLTQVGTFPFPRAVHARLLNRFHRAGARVVAYDVVFAERGPAGQEEDDDKLFRAITRAGNVVLGAAETDGHGRPNVLGGTDPREARATAGNVNFPPDTQGRYRRVPDRIDGLDTLAVATAHRMGRRVARDRMGGKGAVIDYAGPDGTYPSLSFADVLAGRVPAARLRGKTIIVGASTPTLQDLHPTPTSSLMSGPEIQANALATVLDGMPLHPAPGWTVPLLIVALSVVAPLAALRRGPWSVALVAVGAGVAYAAADQIAFMAFGLQVSTVAPIAALATALPLVLLVGVLSARAEATAARLRAVEAADAARRSVERDLHDGAQQRLVALALDLSASGDHVAAGQVRSAVEELRALAQGTYPPALVEGGLDAGLEELVERMPPSVRISGRVGRRVERRLEVVAYFVASEGVANALKHADAGRITIEVAAEGARLRVAVVDDGRGGAHADGTGLGGLRERVEAHGGVFGLESRGGHTRISADLPL